MASVKKWGALATFVLQNAGVILLMRYSKVRGTGYNNAVIVLMTDCAKLPIATMLYCIERGGPCSFVTAIKADIRENWVEWLKLSLPALLYTLQNVSLFIGLANLEAAVAQVLYQMKIFSTAIFSVCLLGRRLALVQWFALGLLILGVLCVQGLPSKLATRALQQDEWSGETKPEPRNLLGATASAASNRTALSAAAVGGSSGGVALVGVGAMLVACLCSSFAGVYFEMMLKQPATSLWLRNIQLNLFSAAIAAVGVFMQEDPLIEEVGLLHGFDPVTWAVVASNAFGGLLVAVTIKYADNILRGFAQAAAVIVGAVGSFVLFDFEFTLDFVIGAIFVMAATIMYGNVCEHVGASKHDERGEVEMPLMNEKPEAAEGDGYVSKHDEHGEVEMPLMNEKPEAAEGDGYSSTAKSAAPES